MTSHTSSFVGAFAFCIAVVAAPPSAALAASCVEIDTSRDVLSAQEQHSATTYVAQALTDAGQAIGAAPCPDAFVLYHLRFGRVLTVHLKGRGSARQASAQTVEDLPKVYEQMVRSLVAALPMSSANATTTRSNVAVGQTYRMRAMADSLIYLRLGYGQLVGGSGENGTAFGVGYRQELDELGVDVSVFNIIAGTEQDERTNGSWLRVMGLYFLNNNANTSPYLAAGAAWGYRKFDVGETAYRGSGPQAELAGGIEFLRASSLRLFIQGEVNLPLYRAHGAGADAHAVDPRWVPTFAVSLGAGLRP